MHLCPLLYVEPVEYATAHEPRALEGPLTPGKHSDCGLARFQLRHDLLIPDFAEEVLADRGRRHHGDEQVKVDVFTADSQLFCGHRDVLYRSALYELIPGECRVSLADRASLTLRYLDNPRSGRYLPKRLEGNGILHHGGDRCSGKRIHGYRSAHGYGFFDVLAGILFDKIVVTFFFQADKDNRLGVIDELHAGNGAGLVHAQKRFKVLARIADKVRCPILREADIAHQLSVTVAF